MTECSSDSCRSRLTENESLYKRVFLLAPPMSHPSPPSTHYYMTNKRLRELELGKLFRGSERLVHLF